MKPLKFQCGAALAGLALLVGCTSEPPADPPQGLEITLTASFSEEDGCNIERLVRYDQSAQPLSMIRGEGTYSVEDGPTRSIPVQIKFLAEQGVVEDENVTMTDLPFSCDQVSVELAIEECQSFDQTVVQCPSVEVIGDEAFDEVKVLFSY